MRLHDTINRRPVAVAFGTRRGTGSAITVTPEAESIRLRFGESEDILLAATESAAGVLTAMDKSKLDGMAAAAPRYSSRAELLEAFVPGDLDLVRTEGFDIPGDGGGARYRRVAADPAHPGGVRSSDGAWWELLPDGRGWNALALGFVGDYDASTNTGTDNAALAQSCVDDLPTTGGADWEGGNAFFNNAGTIYFPSKQFYFGAGIELKNRVRLLGTAVANPANVARDGGTLFVFAADTLGLTANDHQTLNGGKLATATTSAAGSEIDGILIMSLGGSDRTKHGVWLRASTTIRNCLVQGFPGNGIEVRASVATAVDADYGNANLSLIEHCTAHSNGGHGFHFKGRDANACVVNHCNAMQNRGAGFKDDSLLGNFYDGCHTAANGDDMLVEYPASSGTFWLANPVATEAQYVASTPGTNTAVWYPHVGTATGRPVWASGQPEGTYRAGGSYIVTGAVNETRLVGCYVEIGQGAVFLAPSVMYSGIIGTVEVVGGISLNVSQNALRTTAPVTAAPKNSSAESIEVTTGQIVNFQAMNWKKKNSSGAVVDGDWSMRHNPTQRDWWVLEGGSSSRVSFSLTGPSSLYPEPYRLAAPKILLGNHVRNATVEADTWTTSTTVGARAPTTGTYRKGEIALSNSAVAGRFAAMICTAKGTPGTWRGALQAGVLKAATASRPASLDATDTGLMFFDTTLAAEGKPIWWTGTAWVDATGAVC